ncbi:alpha/beta hydrolase fold domain-containing protein [Winogradskyella psychrotolerans]|uniref:alpha/beta hydrolase fold domain-containing protein n=1 Tax=Winogradskyella psychrotolerans TaxID=1344585 RepID=UPI001C07492E|nr:alpha/beta hydrolase fold domain-containing protein [Winogradskyella psychrotolerans]MBU2929871.1 alpha/beta hydrolase fold domain-containing protein [Winogradskyella psychrotolerans]
MSIQFFHTKSNQVFIMLVFSCLLFSALSAQVENQYSKVNAESEFSKLDSNNNGVLEVKEINQIWKLIRKHDTDNNKELTLEEFSNFEIPHLKTKGDINLNLKYKTTKEEGLYLDIYYPSEKTADKKYPIMLYTHGGGWFNGSKENIVKQPMEESFLEFVEQGFAVVSINYRLTRHKSVLMRDCVIDAMDALRYLSKNSEDLQLDADQVYVMGDSAGGHIAQMITLADPAKFKGDKALFGNPYKVIAGISWYGPSDFTIKALFKTDDTTKNPDRFSSRITKKESNPSKIEAMYKEMSPIFYLSKNSPPLFMMAADNDTTIPVAHAYHMKKHADSIGAKVDMFIVKNAGHNWRKAGGDIDPTLEQITNKTVDFMLKYK